MKSHVAFIFQSLGTAYSRSGRCEKAIPCFEKALAAAEEMKERRALFEGLAGITFCCTVTGDSAKASSCIEKAQRLSEVERDGRLIMFYQALGESFQRLQDVDRAMEFYQKALVASENEGQKKMTARLLNSIGVLHSQRGSINKALELMKKSLALGEEMNARPRIAAVLNDMGGALHYHE